MELTVVKIDPGPRHTTVTIRGENSETVSSTDAANLAIKTANLPKGGINSNPRPYPVDADGNTSDELMFDTTGKIVAFQCDYRIAPGL